MAAQAATRQDPASGVGAEAVRPERAPAVDFPKHRAKLSVGCVEPITQRLHWTDGPVGAAVDENRSPPALFPTCPLPPLAPRRGGAGGVGGELGRRYRKADMLDIETDQCGSAETTGRQQQQC